MDLSKIQKIAHEFDNERGWNKMGASNVFIHLIEELGEIARHINFEEGYKKVDFGNSPNITKQELQRELAQAFKLLLQLANYYKVDLEKAFVNEMKIMEKRFKKNWSQPQNPTTTGHFCQAFNISSWGPTEWRIIVSAFFLPTIL